VREEIVKQLEHINETLEGMLEFMKKPESKFLKVLEVTGAGVSILGVLSVIDIIRTWITGG
jgi:preprotein translocase subunit Sss1